MFKYIRQLTQESLIYGIAGVLSRFISFLLVPIYTRLFSPEDYGVMGLITSITGLIQIFIVLGLDSAAPRWYYDTENEDKRKSSIATWIWCQIGISILFSLFLFIGGNWLGGSIVHRNDSYRYFQVSALSLPFTVLATIIISWFRLKRMAWQTTLFTIITNLITILSSIFFIVILRIGLIGVFLAQLLSALVGTVLAAIFMKDWINPRWFNFNLLKDMLRYSFPLIPASLAWWIVNLSGQFFIQAYDTTSEVGLYKFGSTIASIMMLITTAFQLAWGPFSISIYKQPEAKKVYAKVFILYVVISAFIGVGVTLFTPEFITIFATNKYIGAIPVVGLLSFSSILIGVYYIACIGPTIEKNMRPVGLATLLSAGINLGLNFLLVPILGKMGSAISTFTSQAFICLFIFIYSQKTYPIPYQFSKAITIYVFSFLLLVITPYITPFSFALNILIKFLILLLFIPLLFILKVVTFSEFDNVIRFFIKRKVHNEIV
jgi:O-antigen/teichoic acid export membrane protein